MFKIFESIIKALTSVKSSDAEPIDLSQSLEVAKTVEEERTKRNRENNATIRFGLKMLGALALIYFVVAVVLAILRF